jgi:hypothetical protein
LRSNRADTREVQAFSYFFCSKQAKTYPDDFDPRDLDDLIIDLNIYIDNVRADARFAQVATIFELGKLMVDTNKNLSFHLVHRLLTLVLVLPIAMAVEMCFSVVKIVKADLRNRIGDGFMNDCVICFVEQEFLDAIPNNVIIVLFQNMNDHTCRVK